MVKGLCCRTFVKNDNSHISKIRTSEIIQIDKVCLRKIEALTCSWPKLGKLVSDTLPPWSFWSSFRERTSHIFPVLGFNIHSSSSSMRAPQRKWTQCLPWRWESMRCGGGGKLIATGSEVAVDQRVKRRDWGTKWTGLVCRSWEKPESLIKSKEGWSQQNETVGCRRRGVNGWDIKKWRWWTWLW